MTIPRRPFMALLVMSVAGCGGGPAATPATSSAISQTTTVKPLAPAP